MFNAMDTAQWGRPCKKLVVPSRGRSNDALDLHRKFALFNKPAIEQARAHPQSRGSSRRRYPRGSQNLQLPWWRPAGFPLRGNPYQGTACLAGGLDHHVEFALPIIVRLSLRGDVGRGCPYTTGRSCQEGKPCCEKFQPCTGRIRTTTLRPHLKHHSWAPWQAGLLLLQLACFDTCEADRSCIKGLLSSSLQ